MLDPLLSDKWRKPASFCLLCNGKFLEEYKSSQTAWNNLKEKARICCGTSGDAFDRVNWENGPQRYYMHSNCKIKLLKSGSLKQVKKKKGEKTCRRRGG